MVQFQVWVRARFFELRISNWPLKPRDGRLTLFSNSTERMKARTRKGT